VVIPNYNHAAFLHQRIDSVLQQTRPPYEIIILDDCSIDNSREIISGYVASYPFIKFIPNTINSGSTFSQWNKGVDIAKGELVWIAESDDVAEPTFLEKLAACFEANDDVVLAYCQSDLINEAGEITGSANTFTEGLDATIFEKDFIMPGMKYIEQFLIHRNTIPNGSAVMFRKEFYLRSGAIPVEIKSMGDWLQWLRILCFGKIAFVAQPLNHFRRHPESVIAKALGKLEQDNFKDWYGYEVRCHFMSFLRRAKMSLSPLAKKSNDGYMAIDRGNLGLQHLGDGKFMQGWKLIIQASFYPVLQSGFIKKALLGNNKKDNKR